MSRTVIVLPDATAASIVALLQTAQKSLRLKAVEFDAPELIEAVAALARRGVRVRVLLNKPGRGGVSDNAAAREALQAVGAEVANAPHKLAVLHEKSLVIDDERALVMSCDWSRFGVTEARDYAVLTTHRHEVDEIAACFDADWAHQDFKPHGHGRLRLGQRVELNVDGNKRPLWATITAIPTAQEPPLNFSVVEADIDDAKLAPGELTVAAVGRVRIADTRGVKL